MAIARGNVIRTDEPRFEVLGLASIALPGPWWWHTEDMNDHGAIGAIFRCYEEGNEQELGYLLVADVSQDPTEPDISNCNESNVADLDRYLEQGVRRVLQCDGRRFKSWMKSHLNHRATGNVLVTAYIGEDGGRDRQYIDARMRIGERSVIVAGCFDVNRASELAVPIFSAVSGC